ncbi:MAG: hypothetical protein IT584_02815 [Chlamydiae bacterium]|nr:hypothetical protein [Chlamydiota bacterium]
MEHFFFIIALVALILRFAFRKEEPKELPKTPLPEPHEILVQRHAPKAAEPVVDQKISSIAPPRKSRSGTLRKLLKKDGKNLVILREILKKKF